jgi:hypothetical protein
MPAEPAIFHLYAGDAAHEEDGSYASATGVIDHISITTAGFKSYSDRSRVYRLLWRANVVPGIGLWQLFVYDPSGVMLELTFSAAAERIETPLITEDHQYKPRENFFGPRIIGNFLRRKSDHQTMSVLRPRPPK